MPFVAFVKYGFEKKLLILRNTLSWRDVQHLIVETSSLKGLEDHPKRSHNAKGYERKIHVVFRHIYVTM